MDSAHHEKSCSFCLSPIAGVGECMARHDAWRVSADTFQVSKVTFGGLSLILAVTKRP